MAIAYTWLYVRIFCQPAMGDEIVLELIEPLERALRQRGWIEQFFFVRYLEGGHHLRLRLYGEREALLGPARQYLNQHIQKFFAQRGIVLPGPEDDGPNGMDDQQWQPRKPAKVIRPCPSYEYDRYQPETERYGEALLISERHFQQSSYTAFHVLCNERNGIGHRSEAALLLMQAAAVAFRLSPQQQAEVFKQQYSSWVSLRWVMPAQRKQFAQGYGRYRLLLWKMLAPAVAPERGRGDVVEHEEEIDQQEKRIAAAQGSVPWQWVVQQWKEEMTILSQQLMDMKRQNRWDGSPVHMMMCYIHMFCNRIGIFPGREAYLAYLLYQYYEEQLNGKDSESDVSTLPHIGASHLTTCGRDAAASC